MRLIFICQYFPPEPGAPAARTHEHAREWVRLGHDVTVVCAVPHYPEGVVPPAYRKRLIFPETVDGIRVLRCRVWAAPNSGIVRRGLCFLTFFALALAVTLRYGRKADLIAATSPHLLAALAGMLAAGMLRKPFVLEIRDLWPQQIADLGVLKTPLLLRPLEWLEKALYRAARRIVTVAPATQKTLASRGIPKNKLRCVPNGIDLDLFTPPPAEAVHAFRAAHAWTDETFVILYIGAHGLSQGLETILEAAALRKDRDPWRFVFVGGGARKAALESMAKERELNRVSFHPIVPRKEVPLWYAAADVCLVCLRDLPVFHTNIPSKMFEIMAAGRPMVVAAAGQARQLAETARAAMVVPPENPTALAEAL
ncbi:MAG TPA: glycosyltransferase family 4 protein, partial [Candidatus Hydrogenedentes bacterium]|nr:glycosyltransferase family 4 protein [Candidatus Hydrogenedentota bacterium]